MMVVCIYINLEKKFYKSLFDKRVEKYKQKKYNLSEKEAHIKVLNEFVKEYNIEWREL